MKQINETEQLGELDFGKLGKGLATGALAATTALSAPKAAAQTQPATTQAAQPSPLQKLISVQPADLDSADSYKLGRVILNLYNKNIVKSKEVLQAKQDWLKKLERLSKEDVSRELDKELVDLATLFKSDKAKAAEYIRDVAATLMPKTAQFESLNESKRMQQLAGILK